MSKGKDGMTPERWDHLKALAPNHGRWFWRSDEKGTLMCGRNVEKAMKAHLKKVRGA